MEHVLPETIRRFRRRMRRQRHRAILQEIRLKSEPFNLEENAFRQMFRLTKVVARDLIEKLRPFSKPSHIPLELQVLTALNFYAHGSDQAISDRNHLLGLSQHSVSRSIKIVTNLIVKHLAESFIKFPQTTTEKCEAQEGFYERFGMPSILGAVGGTHIAVTAPPEMIEEWGTNLYINSEEYQSINVLACFDSKMRITFVDTTNPGGVYDSDTWIQSPVRMLLGDTFSSVQAQDLFMIGDSAYPLEPWLLTPYQPPVEGVYEYHFNKTLEKPLQAVKRCFGVLKNKFQCLMRQRSQHLDPRKTAMIVCAVMSLHNICVDNNIYEGDDPEDDTVDDNMEEDTESQWYSLGQQTRESYVNNLCRNLLD